MLLYLFINFIYSIRFIENENENENNIIYFQDSLCLF